MLGESAEQSGTSIRKAIRQWNWIGSAAIILLLQSTAQAGEKPGVIGSDDRTPVSGNVEPWQSIGQVNIGGYRRRMMCTGTLIAPDKVLTAAHCVIDPHTSKPFRLENIHFVAGVYRDQMKGQAKAKCLHFPPGYTYRGPIKLLPDQRLQRVPLESFKDDVAVIVLDQKISDVTPIEVSNGSNLVPGIRVAHASYPVDRRFILSVQEECSVLASFEGLTATDCDTYFGSSGGPLLEHSEHQTKIAGVLSGVIVNTASIFVPVTAWPELANAGQCP